jgi:hypothetical protein
LKKSRLNLINYGKIYSKFPRDNYVKNHYYKLQREYNKLRKFKYRQYKQTLIKQLDSLHDNNPKLLLMCMSSSLKVVCFSNMSSWISRFFNRSLNSSFTWFNFSKWDTQEGGSTTEPLWSFSVCCLRSFIRFQ